MKVRTKIAMYGYSSCVVLDLPDGEAKALVAQGLATVATKDDGPAESREVAAPEAATVEAPENAATEKPRGRKASAPNGD